MSAPNAADSKLPWWRTVAEHGITRRLLQVSFLGLFVALGIRAVREVWHEKRPEGADLTAYTDAAWLLRHGRSPYHAMEQFAELRAAGALPESMVGHGPFEYLYPPVFAWLIQPLSLLPDTLVAGLWFVTQWLLMLWIARSVARAVIAVTPDRSATPGLLLALLVVLPLFRPLHSTLISGQVNLLVLALAFGYLLDAERGRGVRAGLWLALGMLTKVTPGILLLHALVRRDLRTVLATFGWLGGLAMLPALTHGWSGMLAIWSDFLALAGQGGEFGAIFIDSRGDPLYFGFWGVMAAVEPALADDRLAQFAGIACTALVAGGCHRFLLRRADRDGDPTRRILLAGSIYLACIPLFGPRPQKHHLVALLPAVVAGVIATFGGLRVVPRTGLVLWCALTAGLWFGKVLPSTPIYFVAVLATVAFATWAARGTEGAGVVAGTLPAGNHGTGESRDVT